MDNRWWLAHFLSRNKDVIQQTLVSQVQQAMIQMPTISVDWHPYNHRAHFNTSKLALLIESRPLPHLTTLILYMAEIIPAAWPFMFIGSPESIAFIERNHAIRRLKSIGKLDTRTLPPPWTIETSEDQSRLMTDMHFYDEILPGVEWLFKYEADSILCANSQKSLDDWLEWNWTGLGGVPNDRYNGAEGLSIRRVSSVKQILAFQQRYNDTEPEYDWFMKRFKVLPGEEVTPAQDLTIDDTALAPMGYGCILDGRDDSLWKNPGSRKKALEYCPEIKMIMDMELVSKICLDQ